MTNKKSTYKFYNVGTADTRNEKDFFRYGFISAGQENKKGHLFAKELFRLKTGDRFFAYKNGVGYVGYGIVLSEALPITEFRLEEFPNTPLWEIPDLDSPNIGRNHDNYRCEYCLKVKWLKTVPDYAAKTKYGIFVSRLVVCNIYDDKHQDSITFLEKEFGIK